MKKSAHVVWTGSIKQGGGQISSESGVLRDAPYGFNSRFEGGKGPTGYEITGSHLTVVAEVPGADAATFAAIADKTKSGCPVSKLLRVPITMTAKLA